jgi:hypothetical protein
MNSGTSTEARQSGGDAGLQPWHFYLLLSMAAAIAVVFVTRDTHPAALLLISAAVVAAGFTATALHYAVSGFLGTRATGLGEARDPQSRDAVMREKALVLRSLKELEFDHAMRKVSDADFAEIGSRLRARAMDLMRELDRSAPVPSAGAPASPVTAGPAEVPPPTIFGPLAGEADARVPCRACGTENDPDARFCKSCGASLA